MTTNATTTEKRTVQYRPAYVPLGTDSRGAHHVYCTRDETVHVVHTDAGRIQRHDPGCAVDCDRWMARVDEQFGWETTTYGQSLGQLLIDTLEVS